MHIHAIAYNKIEGFAITESAGSSGSRRWGRWKNLRLIRFRLDAADKVAKELNTSGHRFKKSFDVLEAFEEDERNTGKRSGYGRALEALENTLDDAAGASVKRAEGNNIVSLKALSAEALLDRGLPAADANAPKRERF
ncbi:hypothetical protein [Xanthomonas translucens]|uniref:hypothetical protein n=1 Tax=Xanthomonas campestris pv. translucens TaxID=343 RepID=UPI00114CBF2E|nr:hypothetical protein [Xanthomonas translucens]